MKILLPINLDRVRSPISSLLREIALGNPDIDFYSFVSPKTSESKAIAQQIAQTSHIHLVKPSAVLKQRFDIVHHASCTTKNQRAVQLAKWRSLGKIQHLFTTNTQRDPVSLSLKQYDWSIRHADRLIAVSEVVAHDLQSYSNRKAAVIPNGFSPEFMDPEPDYPLPQRAADWHFPERSFFLFLGTVETRKRPGFFLKLAELFPTVDFVLAGSACAESPPYLETASRLANVTVLGSCSREEVRWLLQHAKALIFPSRLEGLPLAVIEALGMGLPVLACPESSLPELIAPRVNGALTPVEDVDTWKREMEHYLNLSPTERNALRQRLRADAVAKYAWSHIVKEYGRVYRSLLR